MIAYCHMRYIQEATFPDGKVASLFFMDKPECMV